MTDPHRGVLYPERLPRFTRREPAAASDLVAWFWIPEWDLPDGEISRQEVLSYPAANLVVEAGAARLWGATTRATERVLRGRGWAVGAMLRPAALLRLSAAPGDLVDRSEEIDAPVLCDAVTGAMPDHGAAVAAFEDWLVRRAGIPAAEALLANRMAELLSSDSEVLRVEDAARRLRVSVRTLQRLAPRSVGVSPAAIIRRRRLQEAAQRVRDDPETSLAALAAELGYSDQAHLAGDFRSVLGMSASQYRAEA